MLVTHPRSSLQPKTDAFEACGFAVAGEGFGQSNVGEYAVVMCRRRPIRVCYLNLHRPRFRLLSNWFA